MKRHRESVFISFLKMNSIDETSLVDLVRKYPLLYDLTSPLYNDQQKKEEAWNEISVLMSASGKILHVLFLVAITVHRFTLVNKVM